MLSETEFICCQVCGKRLIKRLPTGELEFVFGKRPEGAAPVRLGVHGVIKLHCIRRGCSAITVVSSYQTITPQE